MSTSTDAILFYGYCWDDEVQLLPENEDDWVSVVLKKRGYSDPWDDFVEDMSLPYVQRRAANDAWLEARRQDIDAWCVRKRAVQEEFRVDLHRHCHAECPMPYVAAFRLLAQRGCPVEVVSLAVNDEWNERLDRFLTELGWSKPHPAPRWWLVSCWS